ncbi:segregation/condensation protein A [Anaerolentibacter hominis]|uniref:segregation and condensation protein A n=1 Tax=Anaerolentibacter hominis TaxID=3079009 RepID=UPI0031B82FD7
MAISVKLEAFEGPLDLLLHLIDKNKVNIYDIPIAMITDQYMEYLNQMEGKDMDVMSEFLLMAATLLNIKAKMLLPAQETEDGELEDPRQELVERLLEYKMYKYISYELKDKQAEASFHFYKGASIPEEVAENKETVSAQEVISNSDVDILRLYDVFHMIMKRQTDKIDPVRSKFGRIEREEVNIAEKMDYVVHYCRENRRLKFRELLERQQNRTEVVVTFLCVLEMMKSGMIYLAQNNLFDEIYIEYRTEKTEDSEYGTKEAGSSN